MAFVFRVFCVVRVLKTFKKRFNTLDSQYKHEVGHLRIHLLPKLSTTSLIFSLVLWYDWKLLMDFSHCQFGTQFAWIFSVSCLSSIPFFRLIFFLFSHFLLPLPYRFVPYRISYCHFNADYWVNNSKLMSSVCILYLELNSIFNLIFFFFLLLVSI